MFKDTPFRQQRLRSWQTTLNSKVAFTLFLSIGVVFIPIGGILLKYSNDVISLFKPTRPR